MHQYDGRRVLRSTGQSFFDGHVEHDVSLVLVVQAATTTTPTEGLVKSKRTINYRTFVVSRSLQVFDDVELHDRLAVDRYDFPSRALVNGLNDLAVDPRVHRDGGFSFDGFAVRVSETKQFTNTASVRRYEQSRKRHEIL